VFIVDTYKGSLSNHIVLVWKKEPMLANGVPSEKNREPGLARNKKAHHSVFHITFKLLRLN
jgi:hypothetical protein